MLPRPFFPGLPLLAAALLLAPAVDGQEQRHRLQALSAVGDVAETETTAETVMTMAYTAPGLPPMQESWTHSQERKARLEVLAIAEGRPTAIRMLFTRDRGLQVGPGELRDETTGSREGRAVTVRKEEGEVTVTADGNLDNHDREELLAALDALDQDFLPEEPVAAGAEWSVSAEVVAALLREGEGTLRCRLVGITTYAEQRCAEIAVTLDATTQSADLEGVTIKTQATGRLYHSLELNRGLHMELSGPVTAEGQVVQGGATITLEGSGEHSIKTTRRWLKVDGRDIGGPTPTLPLLRR